MYQFLAVFYFDFGPGCWLGLLRALTCAWRLSTTPVAALSHIHQLT